MKVALPNGTVIDNIPEGTTKEEVARRAIAAGIATEEDFDMAAPSAEAPQQPSAVPAGVNPDIVGLPGAGGQEAAEAVMTENQDIVQAQATARERDLGDEFLDFLPTATEVAGGIAGLALTKTPAGAVVGATTGYGAGETLRQMITGEEDVNRLLTGLGYAALTESLAGPLTKLISSGVQITPRILASFGVDVKAANEIATALQRPDIAKAGTQTSKEETQQILQSADPMAGLRPAQVIDSWFKRATEAFGRSGIGGQARFDELNAVNEEALQSIAAKLIDGVNAGRYTFDEAGEIFYSTIQKGNKALNEAYQQSEAKFLQEAGDIRITTTRTKALADEIRKEGVAPFGVDAAGKPVDSALPSQVEAVLASIKNIRAGATPREIDTVIKSLNDLSSEAANVLGQTSQSTVKINQLVNALRKDLKDSLPDGLKAQYESMKSSYAASKKALFPSALRSLMRKGKTEDFGIIGQTLARENNAGVASQAFKALEEAKRLNKDLNTFEAEQAIRSGYLENIFKSGEMTIDEMAKFYDKVNKNKQTRETFQAVLGDTSDTVLKIFRAAKDATSDPVRQGALSLFVAGRQVSSLGSIPQLLQGSAAGTAAISGDFLTSSVILTAPWVLSKIATNPKAATKLLQLEKNAGKLKPRAMTSIMLKILRDASIPVEKVNEYLAEQGLQPISE
jgi:hypothetical protein